MNSRSPPPNLPSALRDQGLKTRISKSKLVVFLDYDGTLTPIVSDPALAKLSSKTRKVLERLASICPVIVLSGRDVEDVRRLVGLKNIIYAGSHGFDIVDGVGEELGHLNWNRFLPNLGVAEEKLRHQMKDVPGVIVERKKLAVAVHYRRVPNSKIPLLKQRFNRTASKFPYLKKTKGKKVLELLPNIDWNKGTALMSLIKTLGLRAKYLPVFIGDDLTDEDAFRMIQEKGLGILVGKATGDTFANYCLRDYSEVRSFLELITKVQDR